MNWCRIRGFLVRLKHGSGITQSPSSSMHTYIQHNLCDSVRNESLSTSKIVTRLFHISPVDCSKRLPPGVKRKREPKQFKPKSSKEKVTVFHNMTIRQLADAIKRPRDDVYEILTYIEGTDDYDYDNCVLDDKTMIEVVKKAGMLPVVGAKQSQPDTKEENKDVKRQPPPKPEDLVRRPPVVTIMGHVDHGKTTLLDHLRNSKIVDQEFGGITQHIGAFMVKLASGDSICFLDTPGHAAFSAMRSRGARLTDIIVLVVAADDGVMQQTQEVIDLSKETGVPMIVAINKIDKANADVEHSKTTLLQHDVMLEEFGGDTQAIPISALKGINLDELQEAIITLADLMDLKADPVGLVEARVVEAKMDAKKGRLVTAVIQRGTLKRGDALVAGTSFCKVQAMNNEFGQPLQKAPPGTPVEIRGFKETPSAGSEILQVASETEARKVIAWRNEQKMHQKQEEDSVKIEEKREQHYIVYKAAVEERLALGIRRGRKRGGPREKESIDSDEPELALVLKGDVDGSVEAILGLIDTYNSNLCKLSLIDFGVGGVNESDVEMAALFGGEVYAFNVAVPESVADLAKSKGIRIRKHNIIYRLHENLIEDINVRLPKIEKPFDVGEAKVLEVFEINLKKKKTTYVAGCRCIEGIIGKNYHVKVLREGEEVYTGNITSLKHYKDEVPTIKKEQECGIAIDDPDFAFQSQDQIICFEMREVDQEISWDPGF